MTLSWPGIHRHWSHVYNDTFKHSVRGSLQIEMQVMCVISDTHALITQATNRKKIDICWWTFFVKI